MLLIGLHLLLVTLTIVTGAVAPLMGLLLLDHLAGRPLSLQARATDGVLLLCVSDLVICLCLLVQRVLVLLGLVRRRSTVVGLLLSVY